MKYLRSGNRSITFGSALRTISCPLLFTSLAMVRSFRRSFCSSEGILGSTANRTISTQGSLRLYDSAGHLHRKLLRKITDSYHARGASKDPLHKPACLPLCPAEYMSKPWAKTTYGIPVILFTRKAATPATDHVLATMSLILPERQ